MNLEQRAKPKTERGDWTPSPWVTKLLRDHNDSVPSLGAERAIHYTEFYKANSDLPTPIRKAKALAHHLGKRSIAIHDGELVVGSHTEHRIGAICHVELAGCAMLEDIFRFEKRKTNPLHVDPVARRKLVLSVIPYWFFRGLAMQAFPSLRWVPYALDQLNAKQFIINEAGGIAHFVPDYGGLMELGTQGLAARIRRRLEDGDLTKGQRDQLDASLITLHALEAFSDRYLSLAREMNRPDIVDVLTRVPRHPPSTLREALQAIWFFQIVIQIESLDQGISLGRLDQYLYPLYLKEKARGQFDAWHFKDMLCAFCLKLSEVIPLFSNRVTEMYGGLPTGQAITIGGTDAEGGDTSNDLTFLMLDVIENFKTRQPNWHARWSRSSSPGYSRRLFEVIAEGGGSPALYNDDVIMPTLGRRFDAPARLWNYVTVGCVELAIPGASFTSSDAALFNYARILENVLLRFDSKAPWRLFRQRRGLRAIKTMDDLLRAVEVELRKQVDQLKDCLDRIERCNKENHPVPFSSAVVEGCIETATDLTAGGARYNASGIQGVGVADLANSLTAIEKLVFERNEISLPDLARACENDFSEQESLRARLSAVEKFGNDSPRADHYAREMIALFDRVISEKTNTRGGGWMPGFYSMTCHRSMGSKTSALPSGRSRGAALADGISPTDGSDRLGPTASLNSVAKLESSRFGNGANLNMKFDANTLRGDKGAVLLEGLIKGYFEQGGMQVQINVLDPRILLEAKKTPDKYRNLLVRISGYSAYFVDLTPAMQDEIIERTLQAA